MSTGTDIVEPCPACGQKLRWPAHLGVLIVTCPRCRHRWDWQRWAPPVPAERDDRKPAAIQFVSVRAFENTKQFFEELSKNIEGNEPVTVETPFQNESEFPVELKRYVRKKSSSARSRSLAQRPIIVVPAVALVGGGIGLVGGPIGASVGVVLGLITGAIATTLSSGSHKIEIVLDASGKLVIRFNPVGAESASSGGAR